MSGWKSVVGERGVAGGGRKAEERQIFKHISTYTHTHRHTHTYTTYPLLRPFVIKEPPFWWIHPYILKMRL
jgi:hypothetical protein